MKPNKNQASTGKAKNFKEAMLKIVKYSKTYYPLIIVSLIAVVGATVISVATPTFIGRISDMISNYINPLIPFEGELISERFIATIIVLVVFYLVSMLLNMAQNYMMSTYTQKLSNDLRGDLSEKINVLPLKYFDSTSHGDTLSRFTNDVDIVGQTLNQGVATFVGAIVMLVGSIIMMFVTNWILALTAMTASLIGFVLIGLIMSRSQKYFIAQQEGLGDVNGFIEEVYTNHNVVRAYNASGQTTADFNELNGKLRASAWKSQFFSGMMMPLMGFVGNLGYISVLLVGAILLRGGNITGFGIIASFLIYVRLFTNPLSQIAQATSNFQRTAASAERVFDFLDEVELEDESNKTLMITDPKGDVSFENVRFGYNEDKIIINDFTANIKAGQKVAIVGPTGAGKTTMVNLLMRFYEINSGSIKIDGTNIQEVTRENLHDQFCMVLQDTWLFGGTMLENIIYSEENVSREDVIAASKKLGLDHFVRTMPDGYDTILSDKSSLSEGQKQLITIARAMIKNAPLLILDEATSSVDTRTEVIIQKAMDELMKDRTSFVIAHRLSTIKNADVILVMRDGDIVESGNHDELLLQDGFYAELYNSQFDEGEE
ncbi:MAG TPA: ABC transporter ATP-binding protein [Haploplasma sp.]|nr:ABC transporter ATP-binding protein [Haploplasma sp.]